MIDLKRYSNFRIGGQAKYFKEAKTAEELVEAIKGAKEKNIPIYILGGGTNILWSDKGFDGLVLKPDFNFIKVEDFYLTAGASVPMSKLVQAAVSRGLAGLEWAGGLPGTFGGAVGKFMKRRKAAIMMMKTSNQYSFFIDLILQHLNVFACS